MTKHRNYYTLLVRDSQAEPWQIHFGDYEEGVVATERDDITQHDYLKKNTRIICTADTQSAINKAIDELNLKPATLVIRDKKHYDSLKEAGVAPFDPPFKIHNMTVDNVGDIHDAIADALGEPRLKPRK